MNHPEMAALHRALQARAGLGLLLSALTLLCRNSPASVPQAAAQRQTTAPRRSWHGAWALRSRGLEGRSGLGSPGSSGCVCCQGPFLTPRPSPPPLARPTLLSLPDPARCSYLLLALWTWLASVSRPWEEVRGGGRVEPPYAPEEDRQRPTT